MEENEDQEEREVIQRALEEQGLDQDGNPYKSIMVNGYQDDNPAKFTIRIVLADEDTRSENYGQMVLGLDIKPIFKW